MLLKLKKGSLILGALENKLDDFIYSISSGMFASVTHGK